MSTPQATGKCFICGQPVPEKNLNRFYCSESCRREAWKIHHPDEEEPTWDEIIARLNPFT